MLKSRNFIALLCAMFSSANRSFSQDTLVLPTQEIIANKVSFSKVERINTSFIAGSLADVVETPFTFRRYSPGGLASVSLRGTAPTHTLLYWNDLAIHSPLLGQTDFNLLFDGGELRYGAGSLELGIGGFGGVLIWENDIPDIKDYRFSVSSGSFGTFATNNYFNCIRKNIGLRINAGFRYSDNDYPFRNSSMYGNPWVTQRPHVSRFASILPEFFLRVGRKTMISLGSWWQGGTRDIPPPQTVPNSEEFQKDFVQRYSLRWKFKGNRFNADATFGFLADYLYYENRMSRLYAPNYSYSWQTVAKCDYKLRSWKFKSGIQFINDYGRASVYNKWRTQRRFGNFVSVVKSQNKFNFTILLRYDLQNHFRLSGLLGLDYSYNLREFNVFYYFNFGRNHRFPTLNDLFWIPGGNENLKPESGYFSEFGSRIVNQNFSFNGSIYIINVNDWIQWMPNSGTIWSPMNLKSVLAFGIELDMSYTYKSRNTMIKFMGKGQWNRIFSTTSIVRGDNSKYKQLIYTPKFTGWATISLESKVYRLGGEFTVFSKRYIAADHSDFLPEYTLANLYLGIKYSLFSITVRCQNIFDKQYYSMANRPMPRLNYFVELSYGKIH